MRETRSHALSPSTVHALQSSDSPRVTTDTIVAAPSGARSSANLTQASRLTLRIFDKVAVRVAIEHEGAGVICRAQARADPRAEPEIAVDRAQQERRVVARRAAAGVGEEVGARAGGDPQRAIRADAPIGRLHLPLERHR